MAARLLIFGGTSEARELLRHSLPVLYSAATEYGSELAEEAPGVETITGRLDCDSMTSLIKERSVACIIDATHPYATEVTRNIRKAAENCAVPLIRVLRKETPLFGDVVKVSSCEEAAAMLNSLSGNVLLTVGSKELEAFTSVENYQKRIYPRVLPSSAVIAACEKLGFNPGQIIALQGPFSAAMNSEMIAISHASVMVTKDGGCAGGMREKLSAAQKAGLKVIVVGRPQDEGCSVEEALLWARRQLGIKRPPLFPLLTDIEGRRALVAGGGPVAFRRASTLKKCGADVTVVAPEFCELFNTTDFKMVKKEYESSDLEGIFLASAVTNDRNVNKKIAADAKERAIFVSVADNPAEASFCFPSLVTEGEVAVSVSAGALSPKLTKKIADRLRETLPLLVEECRAEIDNTDKGESGR